MAEDTDQTSDASEGASDADSEQTDELPEGVADDAARLTRLARRAVDSNERAAYLRERDGLLAEYGYTARIREEDDVLVCYPDEWVKDGTVQLDRIDDVDRGAERPLSGPGSGDDWDRINDHNEDLAQQVTAEHGDVHGANAEYLAAFASNHYAKPVEKLTAAELEEFLSEYYPRNAWPTDDQKAVVEESVQLVFEAADEPSPR